MAQCSFAKRGLVYVLAFAGLAGCSSINSALQPDHIDYQSQTKEPRRTLEIPPDLTQLQGDNRYALPVASNGVATASSFNKQEEKREKSDDTVATVAPNRIGDVTMERDGSERWLVVHESPEVLWPKIKQFWQDNGFLIAIDRPQVGVMETDWAENRAKIPQDFLRRTIGKVFDSLYSTGERDKFRTRLERGPDGTTEIYISHRGVQEVLTGSDKDIDVWEPRAPDPGLEAEFLGRLMAALGAPKAEAKSMEANPVIEPPKSKLIESQSGQLLAMNEGFDRAWRRVGLALDRVGFTVEDRDRSKGLYYVRYVDQDVDTQAQKKSFLGRLFSFGSDDKVKKASRYEIWVRGNEDASQVSVLNDQGKPEISKTGNEILSLLNDQLK